MEILLAKVFVNPNFILFMVVIILKSGNQYEISKILKPSGRVLVSIPNIAFFANRLSHLFGNWDYQLSWTGEADSHGNPVTCNLILGLYSWNKSDRVTIRPVAVNYVDSCATDTVAFYGNY